MPPLESDARRVLLVFKLSDRLAALPVEEVERVTPMAELARPPGLPPALAGILNLAGAAIPVLRLDRLFGLPEQRLGLYSMLIVLRTSPGDRIALLADRVTEILTVGEDAWRRIDSDASFNGCAIAVVTIRDESVHVLSTARMILAREREVLAEFQAMEQQRLDEWRARRP